MEVQKLSFRSVHKGDRLRRVSASEDKEAQYIGRTCTVQEIDGANSINHNINVIYDATDILDSFLDIACDPGDFERI